MTTPTSPSTGVAGVLTSVRDALASLPVDALGSGQADGIRWPIRDELIDNLTKAIRTVEAMAGALADCREALRRAGAAGELAVVDAALAAFGSAAPAGDGATHTDGKPDMGEVSDGYHTFNELYEHRYRLFGALIRAYPERSWWSRLHHDGNPAFDGVIAGIHTPAGDVSYHLPEREIQHLPPQLEIPRGKEWDGHTSADVVARLLSLAPATPAGDAPPQDSDDAVAWLDFVNGNSVDVVAQALASDATPATPAGGGDELPGYVKTALAACEPHHAQTIRDFIESHRLASTGSAPAPSAEQFYRDECALYRGKIDLLMAEVAEAEEEGRGFIPLHIIEEIVTHDPFAAPTQEPQG